MRRLPPRCRGVIEVAAHAARLLVLGAYFAVLLVLSAYGIHRWQLLRLRSRHCGTAPEPAAALAPLPALTVQLPVFNEMYVVERLIDAACSLDWPADRLEIQVLDDSTDETAEMAGRRVEHWRARGLDAVHLRRGDRAGFKAGALSEGLCRSKGEFVAVFDADFVPHPGFARRLMPWFADPHVGMVQARWGHLNAAHSLLTRVQALLLDGHCLSEHAARYRSGRFFNFNGTAGIWRRRCIEDAGGWQHDTLTEDLDLSYRAQMRGWRFVFLPDEVAPAELPVEMGAFKSQQHRWARGSVETAVKLLPSLLARPLPGKVKAEAVFHLTANFGYVLTLALAVLLVPAVWLRSTWAPWTFTAVDLPLFALSSISVARFYAVAHREANGTVWAAIRRLPALMAVGIGLSVNNGRAVFEALRRRPGEFRRTPKYNLDRGGSLRSRRYRAGVNFDTWIEAAAAIYFATSTAVAVADGLWGAVPFLGLFASGFALTAGLTLAQSSRARQVRSTPR